jgi:hypothetical protein
MILAARLQAGRLRTGQAADNRVPAAHNIRIFFTDGEEAAGTQGIAGQGSFALGEGLRKLKITDDDVFVFDACGRGDTLVVSTAGIERSGAFGRRLADLNERTVSLARAVAPESWLRLPTPYSDNAGFLASGIASQVITVLPRGEAIALLAASESLGPEGKRRLGDVLARHGRDEEEPRHGQRCADALPESGRSCNTGRDNAASLTAFGISPDGGVPAPRSRN